MVMFTLGDSKKIFKPHLKLISPEIENSIFIQNINLKIVH